MFELRTLGSLELIRNGDGDPRAIPMQAKRLALLAQLAALPPHGFRRRDTLLLLFWPDLDQEHARGALRQALHFLRKTLGEGAILTRGEDEIGLESSRVRSDVRGVEAALAAGDPEGALALYRGEFLEGVFVSDAAPELEDWISGERTRLRGLAAKAAWMASELPANRDRVGELVRQAVHWSGDDECSLRRGVKILDGMGDRAGAAALYDEFARRVKRDFDVELSSETRSVLKVLRARRISGQQDLPADSLVRTGGATVSPHGQPAYLEHVVAAEAVPAWRPRTNLILAGIVGALLMLALAAYIGPRGAAARPVSTTIVVKPFRVSEADSTLAWLSDGIVELLTVRLVGAGSVSAGRVVDGSVTGTSRHLILSASLSSVAGSAPPPRAVAEGPADSLPQVVDRLAAQLLGLAAGMEGAQLASLTSASLPAIRLFLAGQAALHRADIEGAVRLFREAIDLDSSFALAGLQICRMALVTVQAGREGACRIALAGRDRLSLADRALLNASPMELVSEAELFAGLNAAVRAYPGRPDNWYALGDAHFLVGGLAGEERWAERADNAYRKGWLVDSAEAAAMGEPRIAEPIMEMVELAQMRHDTAEVMRLVESALAVDSTSDRARVLMWHRALVMGDSARAAYWKGFDSASQRVTQRIVIFMVWTGIGVIDKDRAWSADAVRLRAHDPGYTTFAFSLAALNAGRPDDIPRPGPSHGYEANNVHRQRIRWALSWDGDTTVALESVRLLSRSIEAPASGEGAFQQLFDICTVGEWQASRGDYAAAATAISRLRQARVDSLMTDAGRTARYVSFCATLLDAMRASGLGLPGAREKVAAADSVAGEFIFVICCYERLGDANIQIARLWERQGDLHAALRAVARRAERFGRAPLYMSTFLREEGRLAALTGDTARAVRAYRHYLAYRDNPQASLRPAADSVRRELAALERSSTKQQEAQRPLAP